MAAVNPMQVMLEPVLKLILPWAAPVSQVFAALALLYCLLFVIRLLHYPASDTVHREIRNMRIKTLKNAILTSAVAVAAVFLIRWGIEALSEWIGLI